MQRFEDLKLWIRQWQDKVKGINRVVVRPEELTLMLRRAEIDPMQARGARSTEELMKTLTGLSRK